MTGDRQKWLRIGVIALAALLVIYSIWNYAAGWAPSRADYATQGIAVSADNGAADWARLGATGVDFAYLTATQGTDKRDEKFADNLNGVKEAGIRYGAVHHFDICRLASDQATLFITTVPRDKNALPPAVQLDFTDTCKGKPNRALILSELATFLNQIEAHSGSPALLMVSKEFEAEYQISTAIDREAWVRGDYFPPDYTAKPWVMWTANDARQIEGLPEPVGWAVVRN